MSAKQIEVQIMGQSYILGCPEGGEMRLQSAVQKVDAAMCKIRDAGKIKARDRIAVLAALNLAFDQGESAAAAPSAAATPTDTTTPESQDRLSQLLQRLDRAIESDGQLL
ncbi:cell division protein ZapA [Limnohabitans sp. Jir72]|uniref:cell division protein ZapA n=1 Tax=Limnohabitans sp. Jir72 TaxID=1977909 RepID=UPI000D33E68B|nr:cell division protein ZapA [Limnohabitans sp. Jir72]PUE35949.1 cell division protein ZapA [Limnohabitans sp. Jir72]